MCTHNLYFEQKYEKIKKKKKKKLSFLHPIKNCSILHRHVCVMKSFGELIMRVFGDNLGIILQNIFDPY